MFMAESSDARRGEGAHIPAPARPDRDDAGKGNQRHGGEDRKAEGVAAGELLGVAQAGGEIEAASLGYAKQFTGSYGFGFLVFAGLALAAWGGINSVRLRWRREAASLALVRI